MEESSASRMDESLILSQVDVYKQFIALLDNLIIELDNTEKERKHWEMLATNTKTDLEYMTRERDSLLKSRS